MLVQAHLVLMEIMRPLIWSPVIDTSTSPHGPLETALRLVADVPLGDDEPLPDYQQPSLEGVLYLKDQIERIKNSILMLSGHLHGSGSQELRGQIDDLLHS